MANSILNVTTTGFIPDSEVAGLAKKLGACEFTVKVTMRCDLLECS